MNFFLPCMMSQHLMYLKQITPTCSVGLAESINRVPDDTVVNLVYFLPPDSSHIASKCRGKEGHVYNCKSGNLSEKIFIIAYHDGLIREANLLSCQGSVPG